MARKSFPVLFLRAKSQEVTADFRASHRPVAAEARVTSSNACFLLPCFGFVTSEGRVRSPDTPGAVEGFLAPLPLLTQDRWHT